MKLQNSLVPSIKSGGVEVPLKGSYFQLMAITSVTGLYDTFQKEDRTKYVVPAGKTLRIITLSGCGVAAVNMMIGKSTAPVTNGAVPTGYSTSLNAAMNFKAYTDSNPITEYRMTLTIATGLYPCMSSYGAGSWATILCEEI